MHLLPAQSLLPALLLAIFVGQRVSFILSIFYHRLLQVLDITFMVLFREPKARIKKAREIANSVYLS